MVLREWLSRYSATTKAPLLIPMYVVGGTVAPMPSSGLEGGHGVRRRLNRNEPVQVDLKLALRDTSVAAS